MSYTYRYARPALTVDIAVFALEHSPFSFLLDELFGDGVVGVGPTALRGGLC